MLGKKVLLLFMLLTGILAGSACSEQQTVGQTTLRFVTWKPNQPEVWDEVIRMFENQYPNIRVDREVGPHSSSAYHDLLTQKLRNRDTSVDVFFMDVIWPPEFAAAGWAEPLDQLFSLKEQEKYLPGPIVANTFDNQIYGLPVYVDSGILYFRKDLLARYGMHPPQTWQEMVQQADRIARGEQTEGIQMWGFSGQFKQYEGLICNMMEYVLGNNGQLTDPDTGEARIAEKEAIDAVRFVRDEIIGKIAPRGALTYEEPESLSLFIQGKVVFMRNWPYAWEVSNDPDRSKVAGEVGITTLPHFPGGRSYATLGGWQLGISRYSGNKEAAWRLIQYLSSPQVQKYLALNASLAPSRKSLYEDEEILAVNPQFRDMKEVFLSAYPRPRSPFYPAVSNLLQSYFSRAISLRESDIEALAQLTTEEIDRIQREFAAASEPN